VTIENTIMNVCSKCSSLGEKVTKNNPETDKKFDDSNSYTSDSTNSVEFELASDYHNLIRNSRQKLKLSQDELARRINIKLSLLKSIENKKIKPDDRLARKFENVLKITLFGIYDE
tara:strand:- start:631 stop:978 length:348 start_codon:yes stop_codon:yes gene_type:complete